MRFRLRTLLILLALIPPILAVGWYVLVELFLGPPEWAWLAGEFAIEMLVIFLAIALFVGSLFALGLVVGATVIGVKRLIAIAQGRR